ncbi:MAG TPA: right-handed parallel beta-helix repeat-containing protein [Candidatus Limnocylindrales bacterium]|nr:right-handed parallel beta-helix repeat-containing protein [Candidatus Limnocylindrales bacterium]
MFWNGTRWVAESSATRDPQGSPPRRRGARDWLATITMLLVIAALAIPFTMTLAKNQPGAGLLADWSAGWDVTTYQELDGHVSYQGAWESRTDAGYLDGRARSSSKAAATVVVAFTGTGIAWIGPVGPGNGSARISLDGVSIKAVNSFAARFAPVQTLYTATFRTSAPHILTITVDGTARHPEVAVDAFVVRGKSHAATVEATPSPPPATPAPTRAPTTPPTAPPTTQPTVAPTAGPTATPDPTAPPTPRPTATPDPTTAPTPRPTVAPTPTPPSVSGTIVPAGSGLAAAVAALPSSGGVLVLRGGNHLVSSPITTSKSFTMKAYPGEVPVVTHGSARPDFLYLRGGPVLIQGITFKTGASSPSFDDSMGSAQVEVDTGGHHITINDVTFIGTPAMTGRQQLFYVASSVGPVSVLNSTFIGGGTKGSGIHMYHDPGPRGVTARGNALRGFAYEAAILVDQLASGVMIESNSISSSNIAIQYRKSSGATIRNNSGSGNRTGLQIISSSNLTQSGNAL